MDQFQVRFEDNKRHKEKFNFTLATATDHTETPYDPSGLDSLTQRKPRRMPAKLAVIVEKLGVRDIRRLQTGGHLRGGHGCSCGRIAGDNHRRGIGHAVRTDISGVLC